MKSRRALIFVTLLLTLASCAAGQAQTFGARVQEIEEVACPLTTVRNLETAILNALHLIPFFAQWEPICKIEPD